MSNKNDTHRDGTFVTTFFQAIDASMKHAITIIALLLPATASASTCSTRCSPAPTKSSSEPQAPRRPMLHLKFPA
jgi:hypothetical protein